MEQWPHERTNCCSRDTTRRHFVVRLNARQLPLGLAYRMGHALEERGGDKRRSRMGYECWPPHIGTAHCSPSWMSWELLTTPTAYDRIGCIPDTVLSQTWPFGQCTSHRLPRREPSRKHPQQGDMPAFPAKHYAAELQRQLRSLVGHEQIVTQAYGVTC